MHGLGEGRFKRKVLQFESSILDMRGKHPNHPKINEGIRDKVCAHIVQFQPRESHYSRSKNATRKYLDSSLSIAKMHRMFLQENPDLDGKVLYWLYEDIFNFEFNISFGYPRSDICDTCERFTADIYAAQKSGDNHKANQIKTEQELHVRRGDAFYTQIAEQTEIAKADETGDISRVIAMDYEKNFALPSTSVGQEYYKRQLWVHNFCIHDNVTDDVRMFLYAEHYAAKGPNEVLSCLNQYIAELPSTVKKLHIFADNCFSQNKISTQLPFFNML